MAKTDLTAQRLRELLDYNPDTGIFTWRVATSFRVKIGALAGAFSQGYKVIRIDGILYRAHRLAWMYVYGDMPTNYIDHINGDPLDNRIANLRDVTQFGNMQNQRRKHIDSKSENMLGSYKVNDRWRAHICVNRKSIHIGYFDTAEQAHQAYLKAKRELHPFNML